MKESAEGGLSLVLSARERLDINLTASFAEVAMTSFNMWSREGKSVLQKARGTYAPYRIRNQTGASLLVWSEVDSSINVTEVETIPVHNDQTIDWRFDDWRATREVPLCIVVRNMTDTSALQHNTPVGEHSLGLQFPSRTWEQIRGIPADREGEFMYSLRPHSGKYPERLLCEVKVVENTKIITLRSTYNVENLTLYPLELMLVDETGHPVASLEKIAPGQDYSLPIDAVTKNRIRIQPDRSSLHGFVPVLLLTRYPQKALATSGVLLFDTTTFWSEKASPSNALIQILEKQLSGFKPGCRLTQTALVRGR